MKKIMFNDHYGLTYAVLEGRKTMTRRTIPIPMQIEAFDKFPNDVPGRYNYAISKARYKVGDIVAVAQCYKIILYKMRQFPKIANTFIGAIIKYHNLQPQNSADLNAFAGMRNKMFVKPELMPNKIRITDIRIEHLQDISDEDILREGIEKDGDVYSFNDYEGYKTPQLAFKALINRISGKGTWEMNPYVFVYSFELVK